MKRSLYPGVTWSKTKKKKWLARTSVVDGKEYLMGYFDYEEEAIAAGEAKKAGSEQFDIWEKEMENKSKEEIVAEVKRLKASSPPLMHSG